ncbi:MAG: hypothetical protein HYY96_09575 [Candidatus Tectomicrobia bacterium]|nr:hypothetical protein [Candidatus Tectomicrobia bacterium]
MHHQHRGAGYVLSATPMTRRRGVNPWLGLAWRAARRQQAGFAPARLGRRALGALALLSWLLVFLPHPARSQGIITTVAGSGPIGFIAGGFSGDGGPATSAMLRVPSRMAIAPDGSLYFVDGGYRIRRIDPNGIITTVAGNGFGGFGGDGGPATSAMLDLAAGVAVAPDGSLYIADRDNNRIRKVDPGGIISTIAGSGPQGFLFEGGFDGDGGPATTAMLASPSGGAIAPDGSLYFADTGNNRIRRIDPGGIITTVAGSGVVGYEAGGFSGDGGPATSATLSIPASVAIATDGSLYVGDFFNHRVRKVDPGGIISTVAGSGPIGLNQGHFSGDGGPATSAGLSLPTGVAIATDGSLYIADYFNSRVRKVDPGGIITTVAGSGERCLSGDGGPAASARVALPEDVAIATDGSLFITDLFTNRIRRVSAVAPTSLPRLDVTPVMVTSSAAFTLTLNATLPSGRSGVARDTLFVNEFDTGIPLLPVLAFDAADTGGTVSLPGIVFTANESGNYVWQVETATGTVSTALCVIIGAPSPSSTPS